MTQNQLNKLLQLRAKMELMFVDFQEYAQQAQAEFQAEQRKSQEVTKKVAENMDAEEKPKKEK